MQADTPSSICLASEDARMILAPYDPLSCTYTVLAGDGKRWGVESLRIPRIPDDALRSGFGSAPMDVHAGDCVVTVGQKFATDGEQADA